MPNFNPDFYLLEERMPDTINTAKSGSKYSMLVIQEYAGQNITIDGMQYTILDHHISIFAQYERINYKSNYHYTAHLKSASNEDITLHIYFDTEEELKSSPRLTNSHNQLIPISAQSEEELTDLAKFYCLPTIKTIRADHAQIIEARGKRFDQRVAELYAKPINLILQELDDFIKDAAQLELIGGRKRRQYLELYKKSLLAQQKTAFVEDQDNSAASSEETTENTKGAVKPGKSASLSKAQLQAQENQRVFNNTLATLVTNHESITFASENNQTIRIEDAAAYRILAKDCLALSIEIGVICTSEQLRVLQISLINSEALCVNLLTRAIISKDQETYKNSLLAAYTSQVPEKILGMLLNIKSTVAFCWLLDVGNFEINTIEVKFKGSLPLSLLEKAFESDNIGAFKALLQNGANPLFLTYMGRPFAHDVLQGSAEFKNVLLEHYISKKQLKFFFKKLVRLCTTCIFDPRYTREDIDEIRDTISIYETYDMIPDNVSPENIRVASALSMKLSEVTNCSNAQIRELRRFPECRVYLNDFVSTLEDYNSLISQSKVKGTNAQQREQLNILQGEVQAKAEAKDDCTPITPQDFVRILSTETQILHTKIRIYELTEQYNHSVQKGGQLRTGKLTSQSKQIKRELEEAQKRLEKLISQSTMSEGAKNIQDGIEAMQEATRIMKQAMLKSKKSLAKIQRKNCTEEDYRRAIRDFDEFNKLATIFGNSDLTPELKENDTEEADSALQLK